MVICLSFCVLFLGAYLVARQLGRRSLHLTGSAVALRQPGLGPVRADFGELGSLELRLR